MAGSPTPHAPSGATDATTTVMGEIVGGVTTFLAVSYIVVVNPSILSSGTGMPFSGVMTATVVVCIVLTMMMGLYAKLPFAVAPGMGVNAFFTFTLVIGQHVPWPTALGIVFWAGVLFLLLSATPIRETIVRAIPSHLQTAMAAGIGLFLTFIGLKNAGLVTGDPVTLVRPGPLGPEAILSLVGLATMAFLLRRRNPFAYLVGVGLVSVAGWVLGLVKAPASLVSSPDFHSVFLKLDIVGALQWSLVPAMLAFLFTDLFDSLSTLIGVSQATGLVDEHGQPRHLREGLIVDAFATLGAGLAGTSSGTAYIESAAGIDAGGRTGLSAMVTALCFVPCFFLAPLAGAVPTYATAPVLVLVGSLMFQSVQRLDLSRVEDALPAFLMIVLIPLSFSITQGILWGFLAHAVCYAMTGRGRDVHPMMYGLALASLGLLAIEQRLWQ